MSDRFQPTAQGQILGDPNSPLDSGPYKFSPDELKVLNECNRESFFKRSLPFASLLGFGTYYGVRIGYFKGHSKFGSIPKVCAAVFIGYFVGKISYQWKCAQKLMEIPNSKLGQLLREKRRAGKGGFQETLEPGFGTGISLPSTFSMRDEPMLDDGQQTSHLDLDDRPYSDFDFQRPPSYDGSSMELSGLPAEPPAHKITYDELRKKNRDEYEIQRSKYVPRTPPSPPPAASDIPSNNAPPFSAPPMYSSPESWSGGSYSDPWAK